MKSAAPPSAAVAPSTAPSLDLPNTAARSPAGRARRPAAEPGFSGQQNVGPRSAHGGREHTRARGLAREIWGRRAKGRVGRARRKTCAVGSTEAGAGGAARRVRGAGGGVRQVGAAGGLAVSGGGGGGRASGPSRGAKRASGNLNEIEPRGLLGPAAIAGGARRCPGMPSGPRGRAAACSGALRSPWLSQGSPRRRAAVSLAAPAVSSAPSSGVLEGPCGLLGCPWGLLAAVQRSPRLPQRSPVPPRVCTTGRPGDTSDREPG